MAALLNKTLAVFGGSFNPPHVGHQLACLYVLETQPVDEVMMVPCFRHPFDKTLVDFADRVEMCRRAAWRLEPRVSVSTVEEDLGPGMSLTLQTLETLMRLHPGCAFRLVMGADLLAERDKWYRWSEVERLASPIVLGRQGYPRPSAAGIDLPGVSSSMVREHLVRGEPVDHLVPQQVIRYIHERGLYRS